MAVEQNKAAARRWSEELWGRGNLAVADEIIAPDYVRHDSGDLSRRMALRTSSAS